jgi:hypothetical protein
MLAKLMLTSITLCMLFSCGKEDPVQTVSMNFKMNGTAYALDEFKFTVGSPAAGNFRLRSATDYGGTTGVPTDFPYWFDIRKTSAGSICAVLMPKKSPVPYIASPGDCNFQIPGTDVDGNPLLPEEIYYYESGTINFTKSNCADTKYFEISCLCSLPANMCDLNGTFNLTFRNGLNQSVTLTEGKLFRKNVFQ